MDREMATADLRPVHRLSFHLGDPSVVDVTAPPYEQRSRRYGLMFWFTWNRLLGS